MKLRITFLDGTEKEIGCKSMAMVEGYLTYYLEDNSCITIGMKNIKSLEVF